MAAWTGMAVEEIFKLMSKGWKQLVTRRIRQKEYLAQGNFNDPAWGWDWHVHSREKVQRSSIEGKDSGAQSKDEMGRDH